MPKVPARLRVLMSRMAAPTITPSLRGARRRTSQAARGAAIRPPASRSRTRPIGTWRQLSETRNPALAPRATRNSPVSTEPMTLRGSRRPEASRVGVPTGPPAAPADRVQEPGAQPEGGQQTRGQGAAGPGPGAAGPAQEPVEDVDAEDAEDGRHPRPGRVAADRRQDHRAGEGAGRP